MKCPKCGYLGFEPVERCRNCGYDFSLAPSSDPLELPLKAKGSEAMPNPEGELPLFSSSAPARGTTAPDGLVLDDAPLITKASPPRPPLAVRRATPDVPRLRSTPSRTASLEFGFDAPAPSPTPLVEQRVESRSASAEERSAAEDASLAARLMATVLDAVILAAIDVAVVYFTLEICGIGLDEMRLLPWVPLVAFLVLQNGGYLVVFTAGGQTLGKMAAGIRVVSDDARTSLDVGRAFVREIAWLALVLPAGLGLLSAAFSRDRRGIHDRFAGTRVVRASL